MNVKATPILLAAIALTVLSGCAAGTTEIQADYPAYDSIREVGAASDLVITGEVVDSRVENLYPDRVDSDDPNVNPQSGVPEDEIDDIPPIVITVSSVRITEVVTGNAAPGDVIEVSQLGGEIDGQRIVEEDTTLLDTLDSTVVLFLAAHEGAPYDLVNPEQGVLTLSGEQLRSIGSDPSLRAPATLDELRKLLNG